MKTHEKSNRPKKIKYNNPKEIVFILLATKNSIKSMKKKASEIHAYGFIKDHLKNLGWVVRNPLRINGGQVFTQNECLEHPEIKRYLGQERPENVVKISETKFYVIEAKSTKDKLSKAIEEAEDYAKALNKSKSIKIPFVSGIAGNDDEGYVIKSRFLSKQKYIPIKINGKEVSGLLSPQICQRLLDTNSAEIEDLPIDEEFFLKTAEEINKILHIGAINKNQRARVMAALLLALIDETRPNVDASPTVLIHDINTRAQNILIKNKKQEFFDCIRIALPPSPDNHFKFKNALVRTIQELENLNIRSAMNSGADVLGKFYEVFLKYGNGAKEIGIVLTPRHITRFAADIVDVTTKDIVYDPTCGTGGFLVAAFDRARQKAKKEDVEYFKNNGLYGIEQEPEVAALAIVNMIFRGDGKNNIIEGNCLAKSLIAQSTRSGKLSAEFCNNSELPKVKSPAATKVLMNPPFALKESDEKEYKFVQHALDQMQDDGLLFSVLPVSTMIEGGSEKEWRLNRLVKENTLISVISFPPELFYPIGVYSIGIVVKKGISHPTKQNVLWLRLTRDGFIKKKGKRIPSSEEPNLFKEYLSNIKSFIEDQATKVTNRPEIAAAKPIDFSDKLFELVPEAYVDEKRPSQKEIENSVEDSLREYVSYLIRFRKEKAK